MAEWFKAAVLKTVECHSSVGSNPTPSAIYKHGEMAELAEGARLLSECGVKAPPRVRIPLSPPVFNCSYKKRRQLVLPPFFVKETILELIYLFHSSGISMALHLDFNLLGQACIVLAKDCQYLIATKVIWNITTF